MLLKSLDFRGPLCRMGPDYPCPPRYVGIKATHRIFAANLLTSVLETIRKAPLVQAQARPTLRKQEIRLLLPSYDSTSIY